MTSAPNTVEKEAEGWLLSGYTDTEVVEILVRKGYDPDESVRAVKTVKWNVRKDDALAYRQITSSTPVPGVLLLIVGAAIIVSRFTVLNEEGRLGRLVTLGGICVASGFGFLILWAGRRKRKRRISSQ